MSAGNEAATEEARTMLRYHQDGISVARVVVIFFGLVFGFDGLMWINTGHAAFAFGALTSLALVVAGGFIAHRHGILASRWAKDLDLLESGRRDMNIHRRMGWEL